MSNSKRELEANKKGLRLVFKQEGYYKKIYSKHFKKYYNGKPTKHYLKLMNKIRQAENISISDIKRGLIK